MKLRSKICLPLVVGTISVLGAQAPNGGQVPAGGVVASAPAAGGTKVYMVPAGTRIPLTLKHEISTRLAKPGDPVYLVSDFPVVADGIVVIPAGMYVRGYIDRIQRPGKVKGRAELQMHFASMIFPNGVEIALPGSLENVPGSSGASIKNAEGTVQGPGSKGQEVEKTLGDSAEGAGVGSLVGIGTGNVGLGAGIGAGGGAAVGVLTSLFARGKDIVFPEGASLEMELARPVPIRPDQLSGMPAYTGITTSGPAPNLTQQSPVGTPQPKN